MKRDKWMKNYDTKKKKKNFVAQSACDVTSIIYGVIDSWTNQKKMDKFTSYYKKKQNQSHNF